ncbi:MAG: hypothetical protein IJX77_04100 [Ruminococcus sp.]|nr:hypothetical protein [Ruminococcus sp.]
MSVKINGTLRNILSDKSTIKLLATLTPEGEVHSAVKQSIFADEDGNIVYLEFFEKSQTNIDLVNSIWFDKTVSITAVTPERKSWYIKGKPVRTRVFGKEYEAFYRQAEENNPNNDLVAVYYIEPLEIYEQTYDVQQAKHKEKFPLYAHLDKYAD